MDLNDINLLTDEQRDHYVKLERLFSSPGWAILQKWAELNRDEAKDVIVNATTWDANRVAKGLHMAYETFANLPLIHEQQFQALADDAKAENEEEDTEIE